MPYPRIHITNVRGHGIPPCPLCVFFPPPGDACSPTECTEPTESLGGAAVSAAPTEQRCTAHRTHLGGYGIPAIPTHPLNNSPTDGTDAHRWFGYVGFSHGIHGIHRSFWWRRASHGCAQMVRLRRLLWEDSFVAAWV